MLHPMSPTVKVDNRASVRVIDNVELIAEEREDEDIRQSSDGRGSQTSLHANSTAHFGEKEYTPKFPKTSKRFSPDSKPQECERQ